MNVELALELVERAVPSGVVLGVVRDPRFSPWGPDLSKERVHELGWTREQTFNAGVFAVSTRAAAAARLPNRMAALVREHLDLRAGPLWNNSVNQAALELATINMTISLPAHFHCRLDPCSHHCAVCHNYHSHSFINESNTLCS